MSVSRDLGRWLAASAIAASLAACATGRQVYQTTQDPGSAAAAQIADDSPPVSLSGAEVGSDRILQLSGNVVLPVYRLDDGLGLDVKVAVLGSQVQASLAAPALLGGGQAALPATPAGTMTTGVAALQGQAVADAARLAPAGSSAPTPLATVDLGGALGSAAPPPGLALGATLNGVTTGVTGAVNPINAAVASLARPPVAR